MDMTPNEYQALALVTEFTPDFVRLEGKDPEHNMMVARAIHACLGLMSEAGEIADLLKRHIVYGAELNLIKVMEESGDLKWYDALLLAAVKKTMQESMERNIAKLKVRFGDKFSAAAALTRDLEAESRALEGKTT